MIKIADFPSNPTDQEVWTNPITRKIYQYNLSENKWLLQTNDINIGHSHDGVDSRKIDVEGLKKFFCFTFAKKGFIANGWLSNIEDIASNINSYVVPFACTITDITASLSYTSPTNQNKYKFSFYRNGIFVGDTEIVGKQVYNNVNFSLLSGDQLSVYIEEIEDYNNNGRNPMVTIFIREA